MAIVLLLTVQPFTFDASGELVPSAEMQKRLTELFVAQGDAEWEAKVPLIDAFAAELSKATAEKRLFVLEQLVYFSAYEYAFEDKMETPFAVGHLVEKAAFSSNEVLTASIENWIGADERLRKAIDEWVPVAVEWSRDSLDEFIPYLKSSKGGDGELSEAAVAYMFDRSPERALLTLERLFGADEDAIARIREKVESLPELMFGKYSERKVRQDIAGRTGLLEKLSADERWWARYFALSVAGPVSELRPPGLVERLANDPHPYVKRAALRFLGRKSTKDADEQAP